MTDVLKTVADNRPRQALSWAILCVGICIAVFTIVTQPLLSDEPLSRAFYVGTLLWIGSAATLWLGVGYAALAGLVASVVSRSFLGHVSIDQELFILIMVGVTSANGGPLLRRSYAVVALPWTVLPFLNNEDSRLAVLGAVLSSGAIVFAYLIGRLYRSLKHDRDRTHKELQAAGQRYRSERRLLARELHDNVVSDLSIISMTAQQLNTPSKGPHPGEDQRLVHRTVSRAIGQLAQLVNLLQDDEPLPENAASASVTVSGALKHFQKDMTNAGIRSSVEATSTVDTLPSPVQSAIYHILKEAITNVIKYGARSEDGEPTCHIRCAAEDRAVELIVRNRIASKRREITSSTGIGLTILIERAEAFGADVHVGRDGPHHWVVRVANLRP